MMWQNYGLGGTVSKSTENTRLWQTEKGNVEIGKNTLAIQVILHDHVRGYIFHGHGRLLLDTIVETKEGAVGTPVEKEIDDPFIMLGNAERTGQNLNSASAEDLAEAGYPDSREFVAKGEELLNRFSKKGRIRYHGCSCDGDGLIFAFENEGGNLDLLLANDAEVVYKAMDTVFISNRAKTILKSCDFVCISNGKSVIVKR